MKLKISFFLVILSLALSGCLEKVILKKGYDFSKIKRIAVFDFQDYAYAPNSGQMAANIVSKYLINAGYNIVERSELEKIINEQKLSMSGLVNPDQIKQFGKISGCDVVITGAVTQYLSERKEIISAYVRETTARGDVVDRQIPHTVNIDAEVAITFKMIDVETGELICAASDTYESANTMVAMEYLVSGIINEFSKKTGLK